MDDKQEGDPRERAAEAAHLNYIGLDGNIACLGVCIDVFCIILLFTLMFHKPWHVLPLIYT